jgi:hypothetical protein
METSKLDAHIYASQRQFAAIFGRPMEAPFPERASDVTVFGTDELVPYRVLPARFFGGSSL